MSSKTLPRPALSTGIGANPSKRSRLTTKKPCLIVVEFPTLQTPFAEARELRHMSGGCSTTAIGSCWNSLAATSTSPVWFSRYRKVVESRKMHMSTSASASAHDSRKFSMPSRRAALPFSSSFEMFEGASAASLNMLLLNRRSAVPKKRVMRALILA